MSINWILNYIKADLTDLFVHVGVFSVATEAVQAEHSSPLRTRTVHEVEEQAGLPV